MAQLSSAFGSAGGSGTSTSDGDGNASAAKLRVIMPLLHIEWRLVGFSAGGAGSAVGGAYRLKGLAPSPGQQARFCKLTECVFLCELMALLMNGSELPSVGRAGLLIGRMQSCYQWTSPGTATAQGAGRTGARSCYCRPPSPVSPAAAPRPFAGCLQRTKYRQLTRVQP